MQVFVTTDTTGRMEITERAGSWRFNSLLPGGWWQASVQLSALTRDLWMLVEAWPGGVLDFWEWGERLWYGRLSGARLEADGITLSAEGKARELLDTELWRIFSDSEYGRWEAQDKVPEGFAADNNNRVYIEARDATYVDLTECVVSYPQDDVVLGADIVRLHAHVLMTVASGAWVAELRDDAANVLWTSAVAVEEDLDEVVANAKGLVLALRKNGNGTGEASVRLTYVVVRTLDPATTSDIVTELLDAASIDGEIDSSALDVGRAIYQGNGATALRALSEMAALGNGAGGWVLAIYGNNAAMCAAKAEFRAWESTATWILTANEEKLKWSLEWNLSDIYNAVRAELPDRYRTAWYIDADSIEYFGARREKTLRVPMTTQAEAATWAQLYLADHAWAKAALQINAGVMCRKPDGSWFPATFIRAGDVITLRDLIPNKDETIRVQEATVSNGVVQIVPVGIDDRLEVILSARDVA